MPRPGSTSSATRRLRAGSSAALPSPTRFGARTPEARRTGFAQGGSADLLVEPWMAEQVEDERERRQDGDAERTPGANPVLRASGDSGVRAPGPTRRPRISGSGALRNSG